MSAVDEARLDAAARTVRGNTVEVPPGARARVAAGVRATIHRPRVTWAHAGLAVAAAAAVLLVHVSPSTRDAPRSIPAEAARAEWAAGSETTVGAARVRVARAALLQLPAPGELPVIRLWRGALALAPESGIDVLVARPVELHTRQVKLRALGARFEVEADEGYTVVDVQAGEVQAFVGRERTARVLAAGTRVRLRSSARAAAPPPVAPPPVAPPPVAPPSAETEARPRPPVVAPPPRAAARDSDPIPGADGRGLSGVAPAQSQTEPAEPTASSALRDARQLRPEEAARIAEELIEARPAPKLEVQALLLLADARRRAGRDLDAVHTYGRVLEHPARADFEQEARYRVARALARLGRVAEAERHLEAAQALHPEGPLAPERTALWARLRLDAGDPEGAASVLERAPTGGWSRALDEVRIAVAQRILTTSPARARALAERVSQGGRADDLVRASRRIADRAREFEGRAIGRRPMREP